MSYTPGPWEHEDGIIYAPALRASPISAPPAIAETNSEANARLIAATPELVEALERHVAYFDNANANREAWGKMVNDSRALLARIKGES